MEGGEVREDHKGGEGYHFCVPGAGAERFGVYNGGMKWGNAKSIVYLCVILGVGELSVAENLLRNGSFEGSLAYWMDTDKSALIRGSAADGQHGLRIDKYGPRSSPIALPFGKPVKISLWIRSDATAELQMWIGPSHREVAQEIGAAWNSTMFRAAAGKQWKRVSFDYMPKTKPQMPWWPASVYILDIAASGVIYVDGVSVSEAGAGEAVARRPVEVTSDITNLPGYKVNGNLLERGFKASVRATAYNSSRRPRAITLRWQLMDYEGSNALSKAVDRKVFLKYGSTAIETAQITLDNVGLMLARVSVLDELGKEMDRSDAPVTVLPFPKKLAAVDPRERIGGSHTGPLSLELSQKIGFRWSRWWGDSQMAWSGVEKSKGTYDWPDEQVAMVTRRGFCIDYLMYDPPKWTSGDRRLPLDMPWNAEDARWEDLSIRTDWDRFVTLLVKRYAERNIVWEFQNEPDLYGWDPPLYAAMVKRTSRVLKLANPKATFLVNCTWPTPTPLQMEFFRRGGAKWIDVYTFHNYTPGELTDATAIGTLRALLDSSGNEKARIWCNEGWTFVNTSRDEPALALTDITPAEAAHIVVRNLAELMAAGQERFIGFQFVNNESGRTWWDWYGPGTQLFDDLGNPLTVASAWNVLIDQLGLSQYVRTIRPKGMVLHVFQDERNHRGVVVGYARKARTVLELPITGLIQRNVMGQDVLLDSDGGKTRVAFPGDRRPFYLFTASSASAEELARALEGSDEEAMERRAGQIVYRPPPAWTGKALGSSQGNPATHDGGTAMWRLDQVWPDNPLRSRNYRPLVWEGDHWGASENSYGGQPCVRIGVGLVELGVRGSWEGNEGDKLSALVFMPPETGQYQIDADLAVHIGEGSAPLAFLVLKRDPRQGGVDRLKLIANLQHRASVTLTNLVVKLEAGEELVFVPSIGAFNTAATLKIEDLKISRLQAR